MDVLKHYEYLRSQRAQVETTWRQIAQMLAPNSDQFWSNWDNATKDLLRNQHIYDSTPQNARDQYAALIESIVFPTGQTWHGITSKDEDFADDPEVVDYGQKTTRQMFRVRYDSYGGFVDAMQKTANAYGTFGNACVYSDRRKDGGIWYRNIWIGDIFFDVDMYDVENFVYRRFDFSVQQAIEKWGMNEVPEKVRKMHDEGKHSERLEFIHAVYPKNPESVNGPYTSEYWCVSEKEKVGKDGTYNTMPYIIFRAQTEPFEIWGRGPSHKAIAAANSANEAARSFVRAGQKKNDPSMLMANDGILYAGTTAVDLRPGGVTPGGLNNAGQALIAPVPSGGSLDWNIQLIQWFDNQIREAYLVNLYQILIETPRMTATEALLRNQEKAALLSPLMGRWQIPMTRLIERDMDLMSNMRGLDGRPLIEEPPETIATSGWRPQFTSPLARMRRAEEMTGMQMVLDNAAQIAQFDQTVYDDINAGRTLKLVGDIGYAPREMFNTAEEKREIVDNRNANQQAASIAQAAPGLADAQKKAAETRRINEGL